MLKILHISDLHFGPYFTEKASVALKQFSHANDYQILVASGDFTQRAKTNEFLDAREYLDSLKQVPCVLVPGNHDIPLYRVFERIFSPYENYKKYIAPELDYTIRIDGAIFVALNSTSPYRHTVNGHITHTQLDFCTTQFESAQENLIKVVVLHHHLVPTPDYEQSAYIKNSRYILS